MNKVLVDCSNSSAGGAVQASYSFVARSLNDRRHDFYYVLHKDLFYNFSRDEQGRLMERGTLVVAQSPIRSRATRNSMLAFSKAVSPDVVYSVFGPTIKFDKPHITGFANAWISHAKLNDYMRVYGYKTPLFLLKNIYLGCRIRQADYWIFETELARSSFVRRLLVEHDNTFVLSNALPASFTQEPSNALDAGHSKFELGDGKRVLCISAYYKHKNLDLVPEYAGFLRRKYGTAPYFVFTLPPAVFEGRILPLAERFEVVDSMINVGVVSITDLPDLYRSAHCVLHPSDLETFSAVYLESAFARKPLIASDRDFAREICGDYATYEDAHNIEAMAERIYSVLAGPELMTEELSKKVLRKFNSAEEKYLKTIGIIMEVLRRSGFVSN